MLRPVCTLRGHDVSVVKEFYAHFVFYARNFVAEILLRSKARFNIREAEGAAGLMLRSRERGGGDWRQCTANRKRVARCRFPCVQPRDARGKKSRGISAGLTAAQIIAGGSNGRSRIRFVSGRGFSGGTHRRLNARRIGTGDFRWLRIPSDPSKRTLAVDGDRCSYLGT